MLSVLGARWCIDRALYSVVMYAHVAAVSTRSGG